MQGGEEARSETYLDVRCNDERRSQRRRWAFFSSLLEVEDDADPAVYLLYQILRERTNLLPKGFVGHGNDLT